MIKRECVNEEKWVSEASFKKLLTVYERRRDPSHLVLPFSRPRIQHALSCFTNLASS
jgi:hypothetical protein